MSVGSPTAGTWSSSQWRPDNEFETDTCCLGLVTTRVPRAVTELPLQISTVSGTSPFRQSAESNPPREAQRETVARWTDDAAVGGRRCPRSRQGLSAPEGMRRYAAVGHRASRTRPTTGARCLRGERRVESHPSRRRVSTAVGTSPCRLQRAVRPAAIQKGLRTLLRLHLEVAEPTTAMTIQIRSVLCGAL